MTTPSEEFAPRTRVLVLAVHPVTTAATRLRAMQFRSRLANEGISVELWSFLRDQDLPQWYGPSHVRRILLTLRGLLRVPRALRLLRRADVVLVQREAMPIGPPLLESWAARRVPMVWDVDDSVWVESRSPTSGRVPGWLRGGERKYATLARRSDEVWAGSEVLAIWCRFHASVVRVVPTVVEVPETRPERLPSTVVSWIGSHTTGPFVEAILPALAGVNPAPTLIVVGAHVETPDGISVEQLAWSADTERRVLAETRVGVYPIDRDHPLADGKCGLKAVLYMSQGVPPVVTPTTTNAFVVRDGIDGLHAETAAEWASAVASLLTDHDRWTEMSAHAHERALTHFSAAAWGPRIAGWLSALSPAGKR